MSVGSGTVVSPRVVKMLAAVVVGLSIGALLPPEPVAIPGVGPVPALLVGGAGLAVGAVLYTRGPALVSSKDAKSCGCEGDCGCS